MIINLYFRLNVLMCTSVASMGCHTSGLNLGIALGDLLVWGLSFDGLNVFSLGVLFPFVLLSFRVIVLYSFHP